MKTSTKLAVYLLVGVFLACIFVPPIIGNIQTTQNFENYSTLLNLQNIPEFNRFYAEINLWKQNVDSWISDTNTFINNQLSTNANNTAYIGILLSFRDFINSWREDVNYALFNIDSIVALLQSWYNNVSSYVAQLPSLISDINVLNDWRTTIDNFVYLTNNALDDLDSRVTVLENQISQMALSLGLVYTNVYVFRNETHYVAVAPPNTYTSYNFEGIIPYFTGSTVFLYSGIYNCGAVTITNAVIRGNSRTGVKINAAGQLTLSNVSISNVRFNFTGESLAVSGTNVKLEDCDIYTTAGFSVTNFTLKNSYVQATGVLQVLSLNYWFELRGNTILWDKDAYGSAAVVLLSGSVFPRGIIENNFIKYIGATATQQVTALWLQGDSFGSLVISNNHINARRGIYAYPLGSLNAVIMGNRLSGPGNTTGIGFEFQGVENTVVENNIIDTFNYGFRLLSPCKNMVIRNNVIRNVSTVIDDQNSYNGLFFNDIRIAELSGQKVFVGLTTDRVYCFRSTRMVNLFIGSTPTEIYVDGQSYGNFTNRDISLILGVGHYIQLNQTTGVSWYWNFV